MSSGAIEHWMLVDGYGVPAGASDGHGDIGFGYGYGNGDGYGDILGYSFQRDAGDGYGFDGGEANGSLQKGGTNGS